MTAVIAKSGTDMLRALDRLQQFMESEFGDWTPAEQAFMLHQLAMTHHIGFDKIARERKTN